MIRKAFIMLMKTERGEDYLMHSNTGAIKIPPQLTLLKILWDPTFSGNRFWRKYPTPTPNIWAIFGP